MTEIERGTWGNRLAYILMTGLVSATLIVVVALVYQAFFSDPPVHVISLDPPDLGELCPGQSQHLTNRVIVDKPVVLFFYLSTMDESATSNINDTQTSFPGRPHPNPGTFTQMLPWTVPHLPPGAYTRALAVRGTDGDENPVMLLAKFEIGANCP